ncbi:MAG: hypothetical protein M3439_11890, partial [Chloroflexota bacterium]|nr:hypothetical protein [Chloroflexota bacterium]
MVEPRSRLSDSVRFCLIVALVVGVFAVLAWPTPAGAAGVVGDGTDTSCTEAALDGALVGGGAVTFNCGAAPVTIRVTTTKVIAADTSIDGGGLVTISGNGSVRIFHVNRGMTLDLDDITVADGKAVEGSGIYVDRGTLNLS